MYTLYLMLCADDSIYTGITTDIKRRFKEHQNGEGSKYVRAKRAVRILYTEKFKTRSKASKREAEIKSWKRGKKTNLIFMNRVFIVHGWGGHPQEGWFPWLKKELEEKGFEVFVPQMPNADKPRMETWTQALAQAVGTADDQTYFVGHSMGCKTIACYLETLPTDVKVGGVVFVAGFFKRLTLGADEDHETSNACLGFPVDFIKIKSHLLRSVAIFSDDDPYVPLDNQDDFRDKLGSEIVIEHNMGHFSKSSGITELPIALEKVLELAE